MTLIEAILTSGPGTGTEIARKVHATGIPGCEQVTPNVVYAVMQKFGKAHGIKRTVIETPTGMRGAMQRVSHFSEPRA